MKELYTSERLTYRAASMDKDEDFFRALRSDSILHQLSNGSLSLPQKFEDAKEDIRYTLEKCLLGVVICTKGPSCSPSTLTGKDTNSVDKDNDDIPIGVFYMRHDGIKAMHHRKVDIGIVIGQEFQGKGYGSEAILWGTNWAFNVAGMHRVQIQCFEFNQRAIDLYQKLGFKLEGRGREAFWHDGRFWDDVQFGMLDREWKEIQRKK
jgi:RimJ/RimL family protein N-acetyltransferase